MEKLKSLIPRTLREMIAQGTPEDLASTCSSLHDYFLSQLEFHTLIRELSDPGLALCAKNKEVALDLKKKGNRCFSSGDYRKALSFYDQALRSAPVDIEDADNNLVATLYINRASTMHKMGLFIESIRDCNRAIILSPCYVKAWYRRGKANASLENYKDATHDMNVALSIESSLVEKNRIKDELRVMRNHHKRTSDASNKTELNSCGMEDTDAPGELESYMDQRSDSDGKTHKFCLFCGWKIGSAQQFRAHLSGEKGYGRRCAATEGMPRFREHFRKELDAHKIKKNESTSYPLPTRQADKKFEHDLKAATWLSTELGELERRWKAIEDAAPHSESESC